MRHVLLLYIFFVTLICKVAEGSFDEIQRFLMDNGHQHVDIVSGSSLVTSSKFRPRDIFFSWHSLRSQKVQKKGVESFSVFILQNGRDALEEFLKIIAGRKVKRSLLLFTRPLAADEWEELKEKMTKLMVSAYFYISAPSPEDDEIMTWYQLISLKSGTIIDALNFVPGSFLINETYNLHGLEVRSTALTWAPFYTIDKCNEFGLECATTIGYLHDYLENLAPRYNFTFSSHRDIDNDWGMKPKDGPYNISGTWKGVMGDVVNKKFDMSLSAWWWNIDRNDFLQFVPFTSSRKRLVLSPHQPTDFGVFTRVFTDVSWMALSFIIGTMTLCLGLARIIIGVNVGFKDFEQTNGQKLMIFTMWAFFVMANTYYCGALTMFFSSTTTVPFNTMRDVIRAYPEWKLLVRSGYEHYIYTHVLQGDQDYVEFWNRHLQDKNNTVYTSEEEGIKAISKGKYVILAFDKLIGFLKDNPTDKKLHFFDQAHDGYSSLMFHMNSPLVPLFKQAAHYLREKGIEYQLKEKWFGTYRSEYSPMEKTVLSTGQTVMAFVLLLGCFGMSIIILCGEVIFRKTILRRSVPHRVQPRFQLRNNHSEIRGQGTAAMEQRRRERGRH